MMVNCYGSIIEDDVSMLMSLDSPVVIFGARHLGRIANDVFKQLSKEVVCFCDNNVELQGSIQDGIPVLTPKECFKRYPNATVALCMMSNVNCLEARYQLEHIGFSNFLNKEVLLYLYNFEVLKRSIPKSDFIGCLEAINETKNKFIINDLVLFITEKCTLSCVNCSALIPYINSPVSYDTNLIIESMRRLAKSVDAIVTVNIVGGEPLLHEDLLKICKELTQISNVLFIRIVSNGTILLDSSSLDEIKKMGIYFHFSNYGKLSYKKEQLLSACDNKKVMYDLVRDSDTWYPVVPPVKSHRTEDENIQLFENCIWSKSCPELRSGYFYLCGYSASTASLGCLSAEDCNCVDFTDANRTPENNRADLINLYQLKKFEPCAYCGFDFTKKVKRAVQVGDLK